MKKFYIPFRPHRLILPALGLLFILASSCSVMLNPSNRNEQVTLKVEQPLSIPKK